MPKKKEEVKEEIKEEPKEVVMETVECITSNVHLGDGRILRAYRDSPEDNWSDGDTAQVSHADAVYMKSKKQVKIL